MPLSIVRDDLANMKADAIVLPSNEQLIVEGGAGEAVAQKAGRFRVRRACRKIGSCPTGSAVSTPAFSFPARYLIHAVGPVWQGGPEDGAKLRSAYDAALGLACRLGCESVALPLLSAGSYGCPAHVSLSIALSSIEDFLAGADLDISLVLFDKRAVRAGLDFIGEIESRIDDAYAAAHRHENRSTALIGRPLGAPAATQDTAKIPLPRAAFPDIAPGAVLEDSSTLEERLDSMESGFSETLLALIDQSGKTDAEVYRRANMTRQHFSKIRNNVGYRPTKPTVLALCVALELDMAQTRDLLERAGFALTRASKFDIILEYFIERGIYDPLKINETLFYFDQPLIGG